MEDKRPIVLSIGGNVSAALEGRESDLNGGAGRHKIQAHRCGFELACRLDRRGSHGRTGLEQFLLRNVSEAVVRYAGCSVEIARIPSKR